MTQPLGVRVHLLPLASPPTALTQAASKPPQIHQLSMPYFWLAILGWLTYFILKRSVPPLTGRQLWLLWLVMMSPSLLWMGWTLTNPNEPIPPALVFGSFMFCSFLYLLMLRNWRGTLPTKGREAEDGSGTESVLSQASNAAKAAAALAANRDRPKPKHGGW